jgi:hypothetical protein
VRRKLYLYVANGHEGRPDHCITLGGSLPQSTPVEPGRSNATDLAGRHLDRTTYLQDLRRAAYAGFGAPWSDEAVCVLVRPVTVLGARAGCIVVLSDHLDLDAAVHEPVLGTLANRMSESLLHKAEARVAGKLGLPFVSVPTALRKSLGTHRGIVTAEALASLAPVLSRNLECPSRHDWFGSADALSIPVRDEGCSLVDVVLAVVANTPLAPVRCDVSPKLNMSRRTAGYFGAILMNLLREACDGSTTRASEVTIRAANFDGWFEIQVEGVLVSARAIASGTQNGIVASQEIAQRLHGTLNLDTQKHVLTLRLPSSNPSGAATNDPAAVI